MLHSVRSCSRRCIAAALSMLVATAAQSAVRYQFAGSLSIDHYLPQIFELQAAEYITQQVVFQRFDLTSCVVWDEPCHDVEFNPVDVNDPSLSVISVHSGNLTVPYYFVHGAFTHPGTYQSVFSDQFNPAVLTVSGPAVPEPPAAVLMLGALTAALALRLRRL